MCHTHLPPFFHCFPVDLSGEGAGLGGAQEAGPLAPTAAGAGGGALKRLGP